MKLELEGREVLRHTNAVSLLVSMGYTFDGFSWKEPEKEATTAFIGEALISGGSTSKADTHLQADIENLRQRVSTLEEAHRWAFGSGKGTSDDMAVFQETVNRGIDQAVRRAIEPGGILYGLKK